MKKVKSAENCNNSKEFLSDNLTIVINSCDKYEDLWYPFFEVFRKNWENCPCKIILNTESKTYVHPTKISDNGIDCLQLFKDNPNVDWSTRYLETLKYVKTKYMLFLMEDCFFTRKVDEDGLVKLIKTADRIKKFGAIYFSFPLDRLYKEKRTNFNRFTRYTLYRVCAYSGLWLTDKFKSTLNSGESPWEYELYARQREFCKKTRYYSINDEYSPIGLDYYSQIVKGKWSQRCVDLLGRQGIDIDFNNRGIIRFDPKETADIEYPFKKIYRKLKYNIWFVYCFSDWLAYLHRGKAIQ